MTRQNSFRNPLINVINVRKVIYRTIKMFDAVVTAETCLVYTMERINIINCSELHIKSNHFSHTVEQNKREIKYKNARPPLLKASCEQYLVKMYCTFTKQRRVTLNEFS